MSIDKSLYPALFGPDSKYGLLGSNINVSPNTAVVTVTNGVYAPNVIPSPTTGTIIGTLGTNSDIANNQLQALLLSATSLLSGASIYNSGSASFSPGVYTSTAFTGMNPSGTLTFTALNYTDQFIFISNSGGTLRFGTFTVVFNGNVNVDNIFWITLNGVNRPIVFSSDSTSSLGVIASGSRITLSGTTKNVTGQMLALGAISFSTSANIDVPLCYVKGTKILTENGYVAIERLQIGDKVVTGGKIIGHSTLVKEEDAVDEVVWCGKLPSSEKNVAPICIQAGALGENQPFEDLWVSPGHGILVKNELVFVQKLINHTTIYQDLHAPTDEYYHVKLSSHQQIYANGVASESLNFNIEDYLPFDV
jgi:hypothetical protein